MEERWFYVLENKSIGPLSLANLGTILAHVSDARGVLVWHDGCGGWKKAEEVPELAKYVIKPPPLPTFTQPAASTLPPPLPNERPAHVAQKPGLSRPKRLAIFLASMFIMVAAAVGARIANSSSMLSAIKSDQLLAGKDRAAFVESGMKTCIANQEKENQTSIPKQTLIEYCSCYMNSIADGTTYRELAYAVNSGNKLAAFQARVQSSQSQCSEKFLNKLLGGQ